MMFVLSFTLILSGMYVLHLLSSKQFEKTRKSKWVWLTQYTKVARLLSFVSFLIAGSLLIAQYGNSIGFISWWIFATPLVFSLILWVNDVKSKPEPKGKSRQNI